MTGDAAQLLVASISHKETELVEGKAVVIAEDQLGVKRGKSRISRVASCVELVGNTGHGASRRKLSDVVAEPAAPPCSTPELRVKILLIRALHVPSFLLQGSCQVGGAGNLGRPCPQRSLGKLTLWRNKFLQMVPQPGL